MDISNVRIHNLDFIYLTMTEEILNTGNAKYWSPNSAYLCYASFDDSSIIHAKWFTYESDANGYVAKLHSIPYPKVFNLNLYNLT